MTERADIQRTSFRLEQSFDFDEQLEAPHLESSGDILVGRTKTSGSPCGILLGKLAEAGAVNRLAWLDTRGAHAIYIVGKRRSGKTYTLGTVAEGLASRSWVSQGDCESQAVLLIDTLNVYGGMHYPAGRVLPQDSDQVRELRRWRLPDEAPPVRYLVPEGTRAPDGAKSLPLAVRPSDLEAEDWASLFGVDTYSDPMGQLLADCLELVRESGYEHEGGGKCKPTKDFGVSDLTNALENASRLHIYDRSTRGALIRRLRAIERLGVFSSTATPVSSVFERGIVTVLLLGNLDVVVRALIMGILLRQILQQRQQANQLERALHSLKGRLAHDKELSEEQQLDISRLAAEMESDLDTALPRGWILIDEAHNYIPQTGVLPSRPYLRRYVNEGRNLGLSIALATQQPSGLDSSIRRNADVIVVHSMSMRDDIDTTEAMLNTVVPESIGSSGSGSSGRRGFERVVRSLEPGFAMVSNDAASRVFPIRVRPRLTIHGGQEY